MVSAKVLIRKSTAIKLAQQSVQRERRSLFLVFGADDFEHWPHCGRIDLGSVGHAAARERAGDVAPVRRTAPPAARYVVRFGGGLSPVHAARGSADVLAPADRGSDPRASGVCGTRSITGTLCDTA